ncbi:MAG: AraC family transcriptional regulator [Spirosomaceae bacterium]|nr:AraC family transcriptional regulator [Spirosomataceae bacterium]
MKADFEKIINEPNLSFMIKTVEREKRPFMKGTWHFHPENEITLTLASDGKRFVGNSVEEYKVGDLVFLGKNVPHCWLTEKHAKQVVIQMKDDFLGEQFLNIPEMSAIKKLFAKGGRGIEFYGETKKMVTAKINALYNKEGLEKILNLVDVLHTLAISDEIRYLSSEGFNPLTLGYLDQKRIQVVYDYILENYQKDISIEAAANLINMTKTSFCKFFKKATKKTFTEVVNEIRIGHASSLIIETDDNISTIAYASGYQDVSYFNRKFKELVNMNPNEFRLKYQK